MKLKLNDNWLFHQAISGFNPFPWNRIWTDPKNVSPDCLVTRDRVPYERERSRARDEKREREDRIAKFREALPKKFADLNILCLAHYAHKMQTIFQHMLPLLEQYAYFEWMMNHDPAKPWYRDHLIHQLRVAYLGNHLLDCPFEEDRGITSLNALKFPKNGEIRVIDKVVEIIKKIMKDKNHSRRRLKFPNKHTGAGTIYFLGQSLDVKPAEIDEELVRCAWWLAALFHDTGYVYGFYAQLSLIVQDVYTFKVPDPFGGLEGTYRKQSADVLFHFLEEEAVLYRKWLKDNQKDLMLPSLNSGWRPPDPSHVASAGMGPAFLVQLFRKGHSAAGALNLLYVLECLIRRGSVNPAFRFATGLAALAILRHDTDDWRPIAEEPGETAKRVRAMTGSDRISPEGWLVTGRIGFMQDPLSFLLALCDHIQEWGRYKTEPDMENDAENIVYDIETMEMNLEDNHIEIHPCPQNGRPIPEGTLKQYRKEKHRYFSGDSILDPVGFAKGITFFDS